MKRSSHVSLMTLAGLAACLGSFVAFRSHPQSQNPDSLPPPSGESRSQTPQNNQADANEAYLEAVTLLTSPNAGDAIPRVRALLAPYSATGDPRALNVMGLTYDPIWRLSRDTSAAEAAKFYRDAASLGFDAAQHNLERLVSRGFVPPAVFHPTASQLPGTSAAPNPDSALRVSALQGAAAGQPAAATTSDRRSDASAIFARVGPAVVELRSSDNYGSGVILGFLRSKGPTLVWEGSGFVENVGFNLARGPAVDLLPRDASYLLIVTNAHVVQKSGTVRVGIGIRGEGESRQHVAAAAVCLSQNPQEDLAFVFVREASLEEDTLASIGYLKLYQEDTPPPKGALVYALGNPEGLTRTITQGLYNGLRPEGIQFDAPISVGSSGGALVDEQANLLGITSGFVASRDSQNLNFALPAARILQNLALSQSACRHL